MKTNGVIAFSLFLMFIFGCDVFKGNDGNTGPAGPTGPRGADLIGDLVGFVQLADENAQNVIDKSGVLVSVKGSNISTTTSTNGRWVLSGLHTGIYDLSFNKEGYGTVKSYGNQFIGGGQSYYGEVQLVKIPTFTIVNFTATVNSNPNSTNGVTFSGQFIGDSFTKYKSLRIFLDTVSSVSSDPSHNIFSFSRGGNPYSAFSTFFNNEYGFYPIGMKSGQTVYSVAYAENQIASFYIDLSTGRNYYAGINPTPSNIISFVVP